MFSRKISGIILIIALAAGISITTTRCYDDNDKDARVTIHLERNDLAAMGIQPQKHFIDRVLEFFSTPAEAVTGWYNMPGNLTLSVQSSSLGKLTYSVPTGATTFTVQIPTGSDLYFEILSYATQGDVAINWGGYTTQNLGPGDQEITIVMIPMAEIISASGSASLDVSWEPPTAYVTSYNIYRSTSLSGPFVLIGTDTASPYNDTTAQSGITYYYRISVVNSNGEGVKCPAVSGSRL